MWKSEKVGRWKSEKVKMWKNEQVKKWKCENVKKWKSEKVREYFFHAPLGRSENLREKVSENFSDKKSANVIRKMTTLGEKQIHKVFHASFHCAQTGSENKNHQDFHTDFHGSLADAWQKFTAAWAAREEAKPPPASQRSSEPAS